MPTIDTTQIAGYDKMTDAEKVAALTGFEIPEKADDGKTVPKATFDRTASELAAAKKALREKQTDEEKAAADRAEKEAADKAERDALLERCEKAEKALKVSSYTSSYLALGYDEKLAKETAEALAEGNTEAVLANGKKYKEALEAKVKADLMDKDRTPGGGSADGNGDSPDVAAAKRFAQAQTGNGSALTEALKQYT